MSKTVIVAIREFLATVLTKGFLFGIVMLPAIILVAIIGIVVMMKDAGPKIEGTVAIIDRTPGALVAPRVVERFSPEALEREKHQSSLQIAGAADAIAESAPMTSSQRDMATGMLADAAKAALEKVKGISIETLPPDADVEKEKAGLATVDIHARSDNAAAAKPRIMLVVIPEGAVKPTTPDPAPPASGSEPTTGENGQPAPVYAKYEVFAPPKLDFDIRGRLQQRISDAIVDARIESDPRLKSTGMSPQALRGIFDSPDAEVISVTKTGQRSGKFGEIQQMLIPMAFILLLFMAVMVSGQSLLTTTIEEKSSRVMEVLLSAVSPMQLMVGKIIGQMGVGLVILVLYSGMGMGGLIAMSLADLVDFSKLMYLAVFFVIAYFTFASMMAAIGSAVSELREAQTLMTPVMMVMIIPWILWMPISRAPNSLMAQILSFVPGANPFVMVIRLCGSEPVPAWQIPLSIAVGVATALFCAWAAAKIFRIGVLMYGKPPNLRTLVKWVRMA